MRVEVTWRDEERSHKWFWYWSRESRSCHRVGFRNRWGGTCLLWYTQMSEGENRITRWSSEDGVSPPNLPPSLCHIYFQGLIPYFQVKDDFHPNFKTFRIKWQCFNKLTNAIFYQKSLSVKALSSNLRSCSNWKFHLTQKVLQEQLLSLTS